VGCRRAGSGVIAVFAWVATILAVIFGLPWIIVCVAYFAINVKKAKRYAVTLKNNEGAFVALCVKKRWDRWTFVDVRLQPSQPGGPVMQAAPGQLFVPYRNILYYQEIQETANAVE
jgi:hypothetical protein